MKAFFLILCLVLPAIAEDAPAPVAVSGATRAALHTPLKEYASAVERLVLLQLRLRDTEAAIKQAEIDRAAKLADYARVVAGRRVADGAPEGFTMSDDDLRWVKR